MRKNMANNLLNLLENLICMLFMHMLLQCIFHVNMSENLNEREFKHKQAKKISS